MISAPEYRKNDLFSPSETVARLLMASGTLLRVKITHSSWSLLPDMNFKERQVY